MEFKDKAALHWFREVKCVSGFHCKGFISAI